MGYLRTQRIIINHLIKKRAQSCTRAQIDSDFRLAWQLQHNSNPPPPTQLNLAGPSSSIGGDQRAVWQRAVSSGQGLNRHRQVYSHLCLFPNRVRKIPFESQPVLDMCANLRTPQVPLPLSEIVFLNQPASRPTSQPTSLTGSLTGNHPTLCAFAF